VTDPKQRATGRSLIQAIHPRQIVGVTCYHLVFTPASRNTSQIIFGIVDDTHTLLAARQTSLSPRQVRDVHLRTDDADDDIFGLEPSLIGANPGSTPAPFLRLFFAAALRRRSVTGAEFTLLTTRRHHIPLVDRHSQCKGCRDTRRLQDAFSKISLHHKNHYHHGGGITCTSSPS
jgi:hypothetical protein